MTFTGDDLQVVAAQVAAAWRAGADRDWSVPAGTLEWSCSRTADHTVDTVLAPGFFLASRRQDSYPAYGELTVGPDLQPEVLAEAVETTARMMAAVVAATPPDVRAIIWQRPPETRPPADFLPRAGLELILHGHDVCAGLGVPFDPPPDACDRLRRHTTGWPMWGAPGWSPPSLSGDPWADLLRASGREPST